MPSSRTNRASVVLVAAGRSTRMAEGGASPRKPFLVLEGLTVLEHAASAFHEISAVVEIVIVGNPDDLARLSKLASDAPLLRKTTSVVPGGAERIDSVRAGVAALRADAELVAIHDAARPLVAKETVERALALAFEKGAALVAVPVSDTIKTSQDGRYAQSTLDRSVLWSSQTPQVFRTAEFRALLEKAKHDGFRPTDDAALYERYVGGIPICEGEPSNVKLTTPADLAIAAALLRARSERGGRAK
jgi:2-C-methyl-D-erythritol 4-phosphate cytidylyltransferase